MIPTAESSIGTDRFSTCTDTVWRLSSSVDAVPPVDRWYHVKMFSMKPTLMMPMLHWKS
jgi:hypothetical protein